MIGKQTPEQATSSAAPTARGRWERILAALVSVALVAAPLQVRSQASELSDLVHQSDEFASRELPRRGYVLTHSDARSGTIWQYWWSSARADCVRVAVSRGRVSGVAGSDAHDCNQHTGDSKGMSDGAKVALAAAAILGVAALAHKSHERDKERSSQSPQDVAEFERGYRDGLYHHPYHNYNNRQDYSEGYQRGAEKRAAETAYRSPHGHHSGYARYVNVQDLIGARASSALTELRARGFVDKGGYQSDGRAFTTWWHSGTRQCLQAVVGEGRVERLDAIYEGNCT
ncbi:hypothetical protein M6I34_06140 [Burkholderiaceae bacterium FT117]|uniref:hypothetical protein n=1 Tax=Zeimonas sediminis TaxID=2944268 RepID=UPI002342DFE0|nr:hypothetical protein [Zeimonas sediminis]MCM5570081.1 hypothetical protein [Zeimonas sediminis]